MSIPNGPIYIQLTIVTDFPPKYIIPFILNRKSKVHFIILWCINYSLKKKYFRLKYDFQFQRLMS
jgi:hypothetical protein